MLVNLITDIRQCQWYGEIWLKYPASQVLVPFHFGHLFEAKSRLRIIMEKFCTMAYARGVAVQPDAAYEFYADLRRWYETLPGPLVAQKICFPAQLQLQ